MTRASSDEGIVRQIRTVTIWTGNYRKRVELAMLIWAGVEAKNPGGIAQIASRKLRLIYFSEPEPIQIRPVARHPRWSHLCSDRPRRIIAFPT